MLSHAAHLMVGMLAVSLAHVTSKVFLHKSLRCSFVVVVTVPAHLLLESFRFRFDV